MNSTKKIGFVGAGSMGKSILAGLVASNNFSPDIISIVGKGTIRAQQVSQKYGVLRHTTLEALVSTSDVICLCVKPADLKTVSEGMKSLDLSGKLLISTLAGATNQTLRACFPDAYLVRSIPNIASEINEGVTLWTAQDDMPVVLLEYVREFWKAIGPSIEVDHEKYIDLASPLSGAAPAFMGMFVEALVDAGVFIGLPRDLCNQLVLQSLQGGCSLINHEGGNAQVVRQRVTSPGGLTAVCMAKLEAEGFRKAVMESVEAGHEKTEQLGRLINAT